MLALMRLGWGRDNPAFRQFFSTQLMPEATLEQLRWFDELMRTSASPENAVRLESEMHRIDVRAEAARLEVPTLIFHPRNDAAVPFEEGRLLAAAIPDARFVPLDSNNHLLIESEPAWPRFAAALTDFLTTIERRERERAGESSV